MTDDPPGRNDRYAYFRTLNTRELTPFLAAIFCLFSVIGFATDLFNRGTLPYPIVLLCSLFSGATAVALILVPVRYPKFFMHACIAYVVVSTVFPYSIFYLARRLNLHKVDESTGVVVATTCIVIAIGLSYFFLLIFMRNSGAKAIRTQAELAIAHRIQEQLVPVLDVTTPTLQIFAQSRPSEKVGGDLVSFVVRHGTPYAYIADVSGHGMQSGLLMNMLTTAIRTVLLDAPDLVTALDKLNLVLPEVKEPQMYATFAGLRFLAPYQVEVALCGHPPILWFRKLAGDVVRLAESELPVGLLPFAKFSSAVHQLEPGDILMLITDGILEATNAAGDEFGLERVSQLIGRDLNEELRQKAERIFQAVDNFGQQEDDQTILLARVM